MAIPGAEAFLSRWRIPFLLACAVAAADQASKGVIVRRLCFGRDFCVIPGFFSLVHSRNTGAAWGMLQGMSSALAIVSIVVLAFLWWKLPTLADGRRERACALGLMAGGIVGNLIDRVSRGEVVDFLRVYYHRFEWPAFNLADTFIVVGVGLLFASFVAADRMSPRVGTAPLSRS